MPIDRRRASIEAIGTGGTLFGGAVAYLASYGSLSPYSQAILAGVLGFLTFLWFGVFATPVVRSLWMMVAQRQRTNVELTKRIEALELKMNHLDAESLRQMLMLHLLEFGSGATTVTLMGDRMSTEQYLQRLRVALPTARGISENIRTVERGQDLQSMLSSTLDLLIFFARLKSIPFEQMASLLISGLGIQTARRLVTVSSIIDAYGVDSATIWQSMLIH